MLPVKLKMVLFFCFFLASAAIFSQSPALNPNPLSRSADSLFFNMKYEAAIRQYLAFIKDNDNAPPVSYARLAFCCHFNGNYNDALKYYDKTIEKKPANALKSQLYSRMAMTYSMLKNKQKALEYLDSAMNNGYFNSYEMENFRDYAFIRNETKFKVAYDTAYNRSFPCKTTPHARDFDFWIGEWDVYNNSYPNHRVGSSVIQNVSGECTILENWQSWNNPFSGKSQNWYDPNTGKWTQLWIGSGGGHQYFTDGEYKDGTMRFKAMAPGANGVLQPGNFIFYNLGPDKVRQYYEQSADSGKTFQPVYDFIYIRKNKDESKIRSINKTYVEEWLKNNENGVMNLFTADASIAPSGMKTLKGANEIKSFWFPKDGSVTKILEFTNEIQNIHIDNDIAQTSSLSHLVWDYKKGNTYLKKEQWGFASTIYKKQADGEWKIIHQMWKDYRSRDL